MLDFSKPQRQSVRSIFIYVLKGVKGILFYLLYLAYSSKSDSQYGRWISLGLTVIIGMSSLISPIFQYLYFKFHIEDDELIIQKGFLNKERKAIPIQRIQSVNINQNIVQRALQIVSLEVETAGSSTKELHIPGLNRKVADGLKTALNQAREGLQVEQDTNLTNIGVQPGNLEEAVLLPESSKQDAQSTEPVMQLDLVDLLKVGLTQNHLKSGVLAISLVLGLYYQFRDPIQELTGGVLDDYSWKSTVAGTTVKLFLMGLVAFSFMSVAVSLLLAINKYWGFQITSKKEYLEVTMGLLNKKEIKIPLQKIQVLEYHSNPLRRWLGFKTAQIFQAQSGDTKLPGVSVPACDAAMQERLYQIIFKTSIPKAEDHLKANPVSHARLNFYICAIPAFLVIAILVYLEHYFHAIPVLLLLAFSIILAYKYGKNCSVATTSGFMVLQKGWLFTTQIYVPDYKMQAVENWRSIFLKRRKELHLKFHTASGARGIKYTDEQAARDLYNRVNNKIIVDQRAWM
ncbi:MAG: PH domain-containing protein [Nonlabens sp.]